MWSDRGRLSGRDQRAKGPRGRLGGRSLSKLERVSTYRRSSECPFPDVVWIVVPYIGTRTTFPGFGPTTDHPRDTSGLWTKPRIETVPVTRGAAAVYCVAVRGGSGAAHHEQDRGRGRCRTPSTRSAMWRSGKTPRPPASSVAPASTS